MEITFEQIYQKLVEDAKTGNIKYYSDFGYEGLRVLYHDLANAMIELKRREIKRLEEEIKEI